MGWVPGALHDGAALAGMLKLKWKWGGVVLSPSRQYPGSIAKADVGTGHGSPGASRGHPGRTAEAKVEYTPGCPGVHHTAKRSGPRTVDLITVPGPSSHLWYEDGG